MIYIRAMDNTLYNKYNTLNHRFYSDHAFKTLHRLPAMQIYSVN